MTDANKNIAGDRAIGTDTSITRRDFLGSTLLASGASLLDGWTPAEFLAMGNGSAGAEQKDDWTSYGGVGEYSRSNGNTYAVMEA
jgi:spermidine dehydrogenase